MRWFSKLHFKRIDSHIGNRTNLSSHDIRKTFIDFFQTKHGHKFIPSTSVHLQQDSSLLFVNAGMNQFKPVFLNTIEPHHSFFNLKRAVNSQKCIRAGGKHNDLKDVGQDTTHHTFFEMLGSWSFGDYFKKEACEMALELLIEHFKLPPERLYFTYFSGDESSLKPDIETRDIWRQLGIPEKRIIPFGMEDNFWEMGEIGPCGPCTEIYYDYGDISAARTMNEIQRGVVEIWNLVFIQYNRLRDQTLVALPSRHVDTGMGLERITAVIQGKKSNYDTDLFSPVIDAIAQVCGSPPYTGKTNETDVAYRTISDHIRMLVISIADRVYPGNTGAELIVRQVLRRALVFSKDVLSAPEQFLARLVPHVVRNLSSHYKYLSECQEEIVRVLQVEEEKFNKTLQQCESVTNRIFSNANTERAEFPVETAILLHNHYGYPLDLLLKEIDKRKMVFNDEEFTRYQLNRERLKQRGSVSQDKVEVEILSTTVNQLIANHIPRTDDKAKYCYVRKEDGTYEFPVISSTVLAIISQNGEVIVESGQHSLNDQPHALVLDNTAFYYEKGGQVCDTGSLFNPDNQEFQVKAVTSAGGYIFHHGKTMASNRFNVGDTITIHINSLARQGCMRAHTATHLLNHALRKVLGNVEQRGSKVEQDETRLNVIGAIPTTEQVHAIETFVQRLIDEDIPVLTENIPLSSALNDSSIKHLKDEVYPDPALIVNITNADHAALELCGGTHVQTTSDIRKFVVVSSKSQGTHKTVMRYVTGDLALRSRKELACLQAQVQEKIKDTQRILSNGQVSKDDAERIRKEIGKLNYDVNSACISIVCKLDMKKKLRDTSKKIGTKIRALLKTLV